MASDSVWTQANEIYSRLDNHVRLVELIMTFTYWLSLSFAAFSSFSCKVFSACFSPSLVITLLNYTVDPHSATCGCYTWTVRFNCFFPLLLFYINIAQACTHIHINSIMWVWFCPSKKQNWNLLFLYLPIDSLRKHNQVFSVSVVCRANQRRRKSLCLSYWTRCW